MSKKELLDPIGSLCRLIAIAFYPAGTKISIQNHVISLDKPNLTQPLYRMFNGDGRNNISEIYDVIIRLVKWFIPKQQKLEVVDDGFLFNSDDESGVFDIPEIINTNYDSICGSNEIREMVCYLCTSFEKMKSVTYTDGIATLAIQFYINILNASLSNIFSDSMLPKNIDCDETLLDYNKLRNLWNIEDLKYIYGKYDECFSILKNPSYDSNDGKYEIIFGIIKHIDEKLNKKDIEFQKLIKNSNR